MISFAQGMCMVALASTVGKYNFLTETNITSDNLENGLLYGLKPLAETFVEIEEQYNINSVLYASMVALESGWAQSPMSEQRNNITSYLGNDGFKYYASKEQCLVEMAQHLRTNYLEPDGKYYDGGTSIDDIAGFYLLGKPKDSMNYSEHLQAESYANRVKNIYEEIIERMCEKRELEDYQLDSHVKTWYSNKEKNTKTERN